MTLRTPFELTTFNKAMKSSPDTTIGGLDKAKLYKHADG
jgi:hypothetical protein